MQELTEFNIEKATAKILMLKEQTAQNIIEIGKTLIEVKNNLEHGQFGEWLKNEVEYTHQTANKFMKIAIEFPNYAPVRNLGTRKLLALAGLEDDDRQELIQQNNIEDMTTRELEKIIKEKKEIKKQLDEEKEFSEELQNAIKQKENQIAELKNKIENIQLPENKVIEKEVIPQEMINEKNELENAIKRLEEEKESIRKRAEKAEEILKKAKLQVNIEKDNQYDTLKLDMLLVSIREFLDKNSRFTYLKGEFQTISPKKKKFIERSVSSMKDWVILMEQALNDNQNVVGNYIYGEGEVINE